ncbi:hypothetical protein [Roseobacter sp.]|uniref:hypothetical protein n=1 Tax=Roseobacter sp. TaxID=1907202 RepID=UPI0025CC7637|nr:hypothetical protein [Roseobacter sp.]
MPAWLWFAPLVAIILVLGLWAFRLGWIVATITETDVINRWAAHYLATAGGDARASDCVARPGRETVWIIVTCEGPQGRRFDYPVDRLGRLLDVTGSGAAVPRT